MDRARDLYEQSLAIAEELAAADPANTTYRRDLSLSYDNLAELAAQAGQVDRARDLYEQSLAIAEELAAADPANTTYRRDLSLSYDKPRILHQPGEKPQVTWSARPPNWLRHPAAHAC